MVAVLVKIGKARSDARRVSGWGEMGQDAPHGAGSR